MTPFLRLAAAILLVVTSAAAWAEDELFVTNVGGNSITVYSRTSNGNTAPIRTIAGATTGLNAPVGLVLDVAHDELFVVNNGDNSVLVFARGANGNTAPIRKLAGNLTGLRNAQTLAVDTLHDELLVSDVEVPMAITVYTRTASGNTPPIRTLSGPLTQMDGQTGIAVDTVNDELVISNGAAVPRAILAFSRTASGNTAPIRVIAGASTGMSRPIGLVVDTVHDEIAVANFNPPFSVTVFSRTANGDVAPVRTITGAATGLASPNGLALDLVNNELVVANGSANDLTVYARTANGNAAPLRTLIGLATLINNPLYPVVTAVAPVAASSFVVAKSVKLTINAKDATKSTLTVTGFIDTGPDAADLSGAATFTVGGVDFPIASFTSKKGSFRSPAGAGVDVTLTPSKAGSSHVAFKLKITRDLTGAVSPTGPLTLRFQQGATDATTTETLANGRFALGKVRGSMAAPALYVTSLHGVVAGGSKDAVTLNVGLPLLGATPATAPDVAVTIGTSGVAVVPGTGLKFKGADTFVLKAKSGGVTSLVLDYVHGTLALTAKNVDLGPLAQGAQPVLVTVSAGGVVHAALVRLVLKGKSLVY